MSRRNREKPVWLIARSQNRYTDYKVQEDSELLAFLIKEVCGGSRQKAKRVLGGRSVMVDKQIVTQFNFLLHAGMVVQICKDNKRAEFRHHQLRLVYEDAYLLVVEKKEGMLSVATDTQKERTAQHILTDYVRRTNRNGKVYVVHRLDRATSGLMMYAKDEKTQHTLRDNWHDMVTDRRYVAVVEGDMEQDAGTVQSYLSDHGLHVRSSQTDDGGKLSVTHYRTIRRGNGKSLIELRLETGRKNQIRVHMQDLGHPIVGDRRYGCTSDPLGRMCLHAFKLCFIHPVTQEQMDFQTEYPSNFKGLVLSSNQ